MAATPKTIFFFLHDTEKWKSMTKNNPIAFPLDTWSAWHATATQIQLNWTKSFCDTCPVSFTFCICRIYIESESVTHNIMMHRHRHHHHTTSLCTRLTHIPFNAIGSWLYEWIKKNLFLGKWFSISKINKLEKLKKNVWVFTSDYHLVQFM